MSASDTRAARAAAQSRKDRARWKAAAEAMRDPTVARWRYEAPRFVVYPVMWCQHCDGDRPHHGPFCCSCGTDRTEETT